MTDAHGSRPYLDHPVDVSQTETLIQWAKYLGTTFGTSGALSALRYYERLGWVSPAAREAVERQLRGLSLDEIHSKKYDEPAHLTGPLAPLSETPFAAHAKSLEFISVLSGDDLEGDMLRARLAKHKVGVESFDTDAADGVATAQADE